MVLCANWNGCLLHDLPQQITISQHHRLYCRHLDHDDRIHSQHWSISGSILIPRMASSYPTFRIQPSLLPHAYGMLRWKLLWNHGANHSLNEKLHLRPLPRRIDFIPSGSILIGSTSSIIWSQSTSSVPFYRFLQIHYLQKRQILFQTWKR